MRARKQSSTSYPIPFFLALSSDHITGATGASPTVTISKNNGSFASPSGAITEIGNGWYSLAGNATDRNTLGSFILHATAASCDPSDVEYTIVAFDPFDAAAMGMTNLDTTISSRLAPAGTLATVTSVTNGVTLTNAGIDNIFKRDFSAITGESSYSLLNAARLIRNKFALSSGTLTVYKEDGSTTAWTSTVATSSGASPIVSSTP